MVGTYIPPHLRNKSQSTPAPEKPPPAPRASDDDLTVYDITNYFWPASDDGDDSANSSTPHEHVGRTLHASAATPNRLAYVLLFSGANPRWETDGIIFTKSSLDLLPWDLADKPPRPANDHDSNSDPSKATGNEGQPDTVHKEPIATRDPIAVFKGSKSKTHGFKFDGYYCIERLSILEPHSDGLIRMLEQKWTLTDQRGNEYMAQRDAHNWKESLSLRWAVVKFVKDEKAQKERGEPNIERLPPEQRYGPTSKEPQKSVNELLAELRVKAAPPETSAKG